MKYVLVRVNQFLMLFLRNFKGFEIDRTIIIRDAILVHHLSTINRNSVFINVKFSYLIVVSLCLILSTNMNSFKECVVQHKTISHPYRRGLDQLLSPSGWVDQVTSLGREGMFELIRRG